MFSKSYRSIIGIVAILLLPATLFAAPESIVEVHNQGDALYFEPTIEAADMILTVTGPCNYKLRRSLRDHGELVFQLDSTTIDGRYRFEVTAVPEIDPGIIKVLQAARQADDNSEVDQLCRDGKLPSLEEPATSGFGVLRGQVIYDPESIEKTAWTEGISKSAPREFAGLGELAPAGDVPEKAQIISPDGVVYNSLCVGFDCPTSPTFGADTIRLQENNLRIHFDDTSTASSFPNQDWRIEANSQANGGGEYLRFVDATANRNIFTVEANAPSNSLYVDNGGRVGNGTANPVTELHSANGDTPTLRLEQTNASGFAPQTWDVAGNETSFFVRDASNGSTLPFRIRPGASSNSLVIDTDGDVGVGTLSPDAPLEIERATGSDVTLLQLKNNAGSRLLFEDDSNSTNDWLLASSAGNFRITEVGSGNLELELSNTGNLTIAGTLTENSSFHLKEHFRSINGQEVLARVLDLPITTWNYRKDPVSVRHMGPMAQDFFAAFGLGDTEEGIAPRNLSAVALAAIQGLYEKLEAKTDEVETLKSRLAALEERLGLE